jgi:hypothetical protein
MTENIQFTPPKAEGKEGEALAQHVDMMHQLIFQRFENHFVSIQNLQTQINELKAAQK